MLFFSLLSFINLSCSRKFWAYDRAPKGGVTLIQNNSVSEMNSNVKHEQHFSLFDNSETKTSFSLDASKSQEVITQFIILYLFIFYNYFISFGFHIVYFCILVFYSTFGRSVVLDTKVTYVLRC